jgi:hypothetical protein
LRAGGCSASLAELGRELCWCEDREVVAEDEQVLVARPQVGASADGDAEEVVVVRVAGADRRRACRVFGEGSVVPDPVGERVRFFAGIRLRGLG